GGWDSDPRHQNDIRNKKRGEGGEITTTAKDRDNRPTREWIDSIQLVLGRESARAVASVSTSSSSIPQPDLIS
ncbi:unnamed protein product, partial [Musa hybrid cultivar]